MRQHIIWTPLRDESGDVYASLGLAQDITLQRDLETELRLRNAELAASEEAKTQLIDRLRCSIDELSNPILEVWDDVLVMPIIGVVDSRRTADMVPRLLTEVARSQASFVIVDLTGVEIVDTKAADHLLKLIRKVETVGARCVLTGIRPAPPWRRRWWTSAWTSRGSRRFETSGTVSAKRCTPQGAGSKGLCGITASISRSPTTYRPGAARAERAATEASSSRSGEEK